MATTEQFSLRWNNFHSNLTTGFHDLLSAADMVDVTLAVDGRFLQAHKIVLSICSPYFKQMFKINPCKHPIVILKDVAHDNMKDILEFMYLGEVNVLRENLPAFLRTAELLQVKGLTGDDSSETSSKKDEKLDSLGENDDEPEYNQIIEAEVPPVLSPYMSNNIPPYKPQGSIKRQARNSFVNSNSNLKKVKSDNKLNKVKHNENSLNEDDVQNDVTANVKMEMPYESEESSKEMPMGFDPMSNMSLSIDSNPQDHGKCEEKTKHSYKCDICLKIFSRRDHLRTHQKNIHGEDAGPFACLICSQLYKNAESLRKHIAKFHFHRTTETQSDSNKVQVAS